MKATAFRELSVSTNLGRLHVRTGGEGPAILFWPSLMMDGSMWLGVAERLVQHYRIVLIDPPGHGDSQPLEARFDFEACAASLVEILDKLGIDRAHYVGNSWGAMIGGTFAACYPDRIGAAILMNGTAWPCGLRQKAEYWTLVRIAGLLGGFRGPLRQRALAEFLGPTTIREKPQVVAKVLATLAERDIRSVSWAIDSVVVRRPDQRALFGSIDAPVLVVAGEEDSVFPLPETRAMAEAIPNARYVVMKGVAHLAGLESPEEVSVMIDKFIGGAGPNAESRKEAPDAPLPVSDIQGR